MANSYDWKELTQKYYRAARNVSDANPERASPNCRVNEALSREVTGPSRTESTRFGGDITDTGRSRIGREDNPSLERIDTVESFVGHRMDRRVQSVLFRALLVFAITF